MSNPFIQFELDAAKKAPVLASALGIHLREAMGGLALMWLHIYGPGKTDTVSAFFLRSFFGPDGALVGEALTEMGFTDPIDATTWRVKGAGRYVSLSEIRREAGRKGAEVTNGKRSANDETGRQKVGKTRLPNPSKGPSGTPESESGKRHFAAGKSPANEVLPPAKVRQSAVLPRQKAALDPRSEISLPSGERDIEEAVRSARGDPSPDSPDGSGTVAGEGRDEQHAAGPVTSTLHLTDAEFEAVVERELAERAEREREAAKTRMGRCRRGHEHLASKPCEACQGIEAAEAKAKADALALQERIRAIPMPPKPVFDADTDDDTMLAALDRWTRQLRARERGEQWVAEVTA